MFQKVRELSKNLAVYGVGDVAIQIVSFLLVPLYVRYLSPADYGILGLLGGVEAAAKLFFRWGLDGSFMRFWYDCEDRAGTAAAGQHDLLLPARDQRAAARSPRSLAAPFVVDRGCSARRATRSRCSSCC